MSIDKLKAVLFDFDGVLCHDRFYDKIFLPERPDVYEWITNNIFQKNELVRSWMRGIKSSGDINKLVAVRAGIGAGELNERFDQSIYLMCLDERVKDLARRLATKGIKTGIVTDNMDIFSTITVPHHKLADVFMTISNSSDHGLLKKDDNGKLFDKTIDALGVKIENTPHIDDNLTNVDLFKNKGGHGFLYTNYDALEKYLDQYI